MSLNVLRRDAAEAKLTESINKLNIDASMRQSKKSEVDNKKEVKTKDTGVKLSIPDAQPKDSKKEMILLPPESTLKVPDKVSTVVIRPMSQYITVGCDNLDEFKKKYGEDALWERRIYSGTVRYYKARDRGNVVMPAAARAIAEARGDIVDDGKGNPRVAPDIDMPIRRVRAKKCKTILKEWIMRNSEAKCAWLIIEINNHHPGTFGNPESEQQYKVIAATTPASVSDQDEEDEVHPNPSPV